MADRVHPKYARLRGERARLKTLLTHQLYGAFPEFIGVDLDFLDFLDAVTRNRAGRRVWRAKVRIVQQWARKTVVPSNQQPVLMREVQRVVFRMDFIAGQMEQLEAELQPMLEAVPETTFLMTMPGLGWRTAAGLIAHIGDITRFEHGRQLVKLAGLNPTRNESGSSAGRTTFSRRGRAGLRKVVYMATLSALSHNPRIRAHYERLRQRRKNPLTKMKALGACMTKFLLYAFSVMRRQVPFDIDHEWRSPIPAS